MADGHQVSILQHVPSPQQATTPPKGPSLPSLPCKIPKILWPVAISINTWDVSHPKKKRRQQLAAETRSSPEGPVSVAPLSNWRVKTAAVPQGLPASLLGLTGWDGGFFGNETIGAFMGH